MIKACNVCREHKSHLEFAVRRASVDGRCATCKVCARARCDRWRADHPKAHADWYAQNRTRKAEYWQRWRSTNGDKAREAYKRWAAANPDKVNANVANRIAQKNRAMPKWANRQQIAVVYQQALAMTRQTGTRHDVDHIVPLRSPIVCGLHWEGNLQILTRAENLKKSNRLIA